jgi:hypothetical protein
MDLYGAPEIFNTDQGVQFTSAAFIDELAARGVRVSMDGKGRFLDNIFIERLWRSLKYEEVFIKAYGSVREARGGIGVWLIFYNDVRLHQALGYRPPREIFEAAQARGYVDHAGALTTYPLAQQQQEKDSINLEKVLQILLSPRTGRGGCKRRESLLTQPVSCPMDGVHLRDQRGPAAAGGLNIVVRHSESSGPCRHARPRSSPAPCWWCCPAR